MEAISIILALVAVIAAIAFAISIVMLLVKKWRSKGKRIALVSFVTMIAAPIAGMSLDGVVNKQAQANRQVVLEEKEAAEERIRDVQDKQAKEAGYKDYEDQKRAERQAQAKANEEARIKALAGFPDKQTQSDAKAVGITRYEAYKLLENDKAISRYCAYSTQANVIERDKHSQMDAATSETAKTAIWDKYEGLQKKLIDTLNNDLGLVAFEYVELSQAGYWDWRCRAAEDNWSVMKERDAKAATRADAKEATEALRAFYQYNLDNETSLFFSKKRYSTVHCEWETHNNMRFVGCRLQSFSYQSNWQMFLVGRIDGGRLAIYPINGDTSGKLNNAQGRFHDQVFGNRIFIKAYEQPHAYLARYAGPRIDIAAVRKAFE